MKKPVVQFRYVSGQHTITGDVVNPGGWFGKVWIIQIAIANALNPFFAVEAKDAQDAIDQFADSDTYSHLIDVNEDDVEEDEEDVYTRAGNDGHLVDLNNVHIQAAPKDVQYYVEWSPENENFSSGVDTAIDELDDE